MSDLFHEDVPDRYVDRVGKIMSTANWHIFQVLTKRHERMQKLLSGRLRGLSLLRHIWWGVSVEDKEYGLPRVDVLRETPAAVRFLSIEPLLEDLGELDLSGIDWVIVGGESGPGARRMEATWVRSIRDQCQRAKVPFFFKQWGGVRKKENGRNLDSRTWDELPALLPQGFGNVAFPR
jgi:protein gp37